MDILVLKQVVFVGAIVGGLFCITKLNNYVNNYKQSNRAENYLTHSLPNILKWDTKSLESFFLLDRVDKKLQKFITQTKTNFGECMLTSTPDCHIKTNDVSCPFAQDLKQTISCDVSIACKKSYTNKLTVELKKTDFKCIGFSLVSY